MKKAVIRTIVIISVIYIIISSIYTFFYKAVAQEQLQIMEDSLDSIYNETFETRVREQNIINQRKTIEMLDINISILIVSIVLGTVINLIIEAKENSKIKYILYFIFGNIIYNILWMGIVYIIMGLPIRVYSFINAYLSTMKTVFLPYVLLYIMFIIINILINKSKVNRLNETLKGNKENKKKKYIKHTIIVLVTIILVFFLFNIASKSYVLIKYSEAIESFNKNENYCVEEIFSTNSRRIYYYKDGVLKEKSGENELYYNEKEQQSINIFKENKALISSERLFTSFYTKPVYNHFFGDDSKRIWSNIVMSFNVNLKIEEIDGTPYYVLEKGTQKFYIDKETFLLKRVLSMSKGLDSETGIIVDKESVTNYVYKINTVTNEQIAIPDLSNYEIYTDLEELVKSMNN